MSFREWEEVRLQDVINFNPKETIKKGAVVKKIGMEKLKQFQRKIEGYDLTGFSSGTKFRNGDTLLARITPCLENGKTAQVTILEDGEIGFGSTEYIVMREKTGRTVNDFIFYLAISPKIRDIAIKSMSGTSGRQRAQIDVIKNTIINIPPINEQNAIAHILSTLDEKIEVNNQINKTLEKMAQAIFKQWFVDFEFPNEDGEPYQSSGGEMVESELGLVPKGWGVGSFTDYIDVLSGGTPKTKNKEYWDGEIPFFTPKDTNGTYCICTEKSLTEVGLNSCNSKLYDENTIFITARGTVGKIAMAGVKMAMNQSCYALVGKGEMNQFYVWFQIKSAVEKLQRKASGSVFDAIIIDTFKSIKIIKPDTASVEQFRLIVEPVFQSIQSKYFENEKLVSIRDSLLSKLMTGEIRVSLR